MVTATAAWMRGCAVDVAARTITGGPFADGVTATISMLYGPRAPIEVAPGVFTGWIDPATGQRVDYHYGFDSYTAMGQGEPLLALGYGKVTRVIVGDPSFGNAVECEYQGEDAVYRSLYLHLRDVPPVRVGDAVTPGQVVGYLGTTGASTGPHLHMAMYRNDNIIDPLSELAQAHAVGYVPQAPPAAPVYPVPDVQWVPQGWGREGDAPWAHLYSMKARTTLAGANIQLIRTGRDLDGFETFDLRIEDY